MHSFYPNRPARASPCSGPCSYLRFPHVAAIHEVQGRLLRLQERDPIEGAALARRVQKTVAQLDEVAGELYKHRKSGDHAHLHPELTTSYARIYTMLITPTTGPQPRRDSGSTTSSRSSRSTPDACERS